jgi:outer membrane protein assembly factor BamB
VPFTCACAGDPAMGPDGKVYARTRDGAVVIFDQAVKKDGLQTLVPPVPGELTRTGPTIGPDGGVYVAYGSGLTAYSPEGALRWRRDDISCGSPPSVGPGGVIFAASLQGRLHALDPADGNDTAPKEVSAGEGFLSHVAVGLDGTAYAVSARGRLVWFSNDGSFRTVALPESDYALAPAVTLAGEVVVASSRGTVYRLPARPVSAPKTPFFEAGEPIRQGPLVGGEGRVVLITESGVLITIDPTGRSRTSDLDARDASPPAIARDGGLIFLTRDGRVFATRR